MFLKILEKIIVSLFGLDFNDIIFLITVKIAPEGQTVYMALKDSNQLGWFSIPSPPDTLQDYVSFTSATHEPDGVWVNSTGTVVYTGGEYDGKLGITLLNDGIPGAQYHANLADDLPSTWA